MNNVKKIIKYVILIIAIYFLTKFLVYIGFNATYRDIRVEGNVPEQINVEYAQATKVNGRILGKIKNGDNDLNGKYIRADIFNKKNELVGTKYLEISQINKDETKKFAVFFKKESVDHCNLSIVDHKDESTEKLFDGVFLTEDLKTRLIISALIYMMFF